ncbi:MAG: septum formation initiator family protein [Blastocatellia bacterium]|nr:septum formation initiator family protein [Blastocatellia bacterium]
MSQAINTLPVNRLNPSSKANAVAGRKVRFRHLVDGLIAMILLAAAAIGVSVYWRTSSEMNAAVAKHEAAARKVEELKIETEQLKLEVESLKTDDGLIESVARHKLGLVRPGDIVIQVDPGSSGARTVDARMPNLTPRSGQSYTGTSH